MWPKHVATYIKRALQKHIPSISRGIQRYTCTLPCTHCAYIYFYFHLPRPVTTWHLLSTIGVIKLGFIVMFQNVCVFVCVYLSVNRYLKRCSTNQLARHPYEQWMKCFGLEKSNPRLRSFWGVCVGGLGGGALRNFSPTITDEGDFQGITGKW